MNNSWVVLPDLHHPVEDPLFIDLSEELIRIVRPIGLIQTGDAVDFPQISSYPKDPTKVNTVYEDLMRYSEQIDRWSRFKSLKFFYQLEGNHCARLQRFISTKAPEIHALIKTVPDVLEFPERNRSGQIRYKWFPYAQWDACRVNDVVIHHGFYFDRHLAVNNLKRYGVKFIQGHSHRFQYASDGKIWSVSLGHGSDPKKTSHMPTPSDWQQAMGVLHVVNGKGHFEPVLVSGGKAIFRGVRL